MLFEEAWIPLIFCFEGDLEGTASLLPPTDLELELLIGFALDEFPSCLPFLLEDLPAGLNGAKPLFPFSGSPPASAFAMPLKYSCCIDGEEVSACDQKPKERKHGKGHASDDEGQNISEQNLL